MASNTGALRSFAFLGPRGTFTERALDQVPEARTGERVPVASVAGALAALMDGRVDAAMIAVENSIEGVVTSTADALAGTEGLRIVSEHLVNVNFALVAPPGVQLADIATVAAHPVALAQCGGWLAEHLPGVGHLPQPSNIQAAEAALAGHAEAAISTPWVSELLPAMHVLAANIANVANAETRFVLIARDAPLPAPTGADKTSIIVEAPTDRSGSLLELLEQFAARGVNLTLIQSRPIGDRLGRYRFVIDLEGHVRDPRVAEALLGLHRAATKVTFLGSYPRADQVPAQVEERFTDAAFQDAQAWLDGILGA